MRLFFVPNLEQQYRLAHKGMYVDPVQYTQLIEEVRSLKAVNQLLSYENKAFLQQYANQKTQKQKLIHEYNQFRQKVKIDQQQTLQSCKKEVQKIITECQNRKQAEVDFFQKKIIALQKGSYRKLKNLQIQFKDLRLKNYMNDQFVSKMLKLYNSQKNVGLPQLYLWMKKLTARKQNRQASNKNDSIIESNSKENTKNMKSLKKVSQSKIQQSKSKKSLLLTVPQYNL